MFTRLMYFYELQMVPNIKGGVKRNSLLMNSISTVFYFMKHNHQPAFRIT